MGVCVGVALLVCGGIHHLGVQRNRRLSDALNELQIGATTLVPWLDRTNRRALRRFEYMEPPQSFGS